MNIEEVTETFELMDEWEDRYRFIIDLGRNLPDFDESDQTEEEVIDLLIADQENEDYNTLAGILFGLGFLLVLISFGARKKKGKPTKQVEKKVE